ncbi:MAG: hypothetical protein G01um10148_717 [Parcubacteria group bacterium Gr01-1014_8]|nr:MAG: hypothetical protein G01um10148_717 [Parcubacteria group bacterium Gr01-1014_8]
MRLLSAEKILRGISTRTYWAILFGMLSIAVFQFSGALQMQDGIVSSETRFTEYSGSGLRIVPASCPSNPHQSGDCDTPIQPSSGCVIYASPLTVASGQVSNLSWSSETDPINPWTRTLSPTPGGVAWAGSWSVTPTQSTTYTLTGTRSSVQSGDALVQTESWSCNVTVTVNAACSPQFTCVGNDLYRRVNPPTCSNQFEQACAYGCANGACLSGGGDASAADIAVSPSLIRAGETTEVSWISSGITSCTVTEDNPDITDAWSGTSGTQTSSAISTQTTYTLSCTKSSGGVFLPKPTATVNIIPIFQEL